MEYPSWKDIVREELLSDFKDYNDKKKNEEQLSLLKQKFNLIKKIYRSNNPLQPRYFLLRVYMFIIGTYYLKLANSIDLEFFDYSGWMTIFMTLIHIALLILVFILLFKLPYVLYNKMFGRNWNLYPRFYSEEQGWISNKFAKKDLRKMIHNIKDLPNYKLQNLKLFHPIHIEHSGYFWRIVVEVLSIMLPIAYIFDYPVPFDSTNPLHYFQVILVISPSILKISDRAFGFSSLFINYKINEKSL